MWAYEDAPYAIHTPGATAQRLPELGPSIGAEELGHVDDSFETKLQAAACYRSQLPVIFRFTADFRAALRAHARDAGGGQALGERFWPVLS